MLEPNRPALTPAMVSGALLALVGPLAEALSAFGVYHVSPAQQSAVNHLIVALTGFAVALVAADAYLRGKRNDAHSQALHAEAFTHQIPAQSPVFETPSGNTPEDADTDLPAELHDTPPADPSSIPPDKGDAGIKAVKS
jgi:hypothetical protein